jgi:hypothetical protein
MSVEVFIRSRTSGGVSTILALAGRRPKIKKTPYGGVMWIA